MSYAVSIDLSRPPLAASMRCWAIISLLAMTALFAYLSFEAFLQDHHDQDQREEQEEQQKRLAEQRYQYALAYPLRVGP